jgi:hypothetical protein
MKRIFITIIAMVNFAIAFSQQENEFVEVIVKDTIKINPDEIIYSLILEDNSPEVYVSNIVITDKASKKTGKTFDSEKTREKIRKLITDEKVDTLNISDYTVKNEFYTNRIKTQFLLRFTNINQLLAFVKEIKPLSNILGYVVSKKSAQTDSYQNMLTKRLLAKAFNDALYIAEQSKKTIGKLIQVSDEKSESTIGGWTSYPPLSRYTDVTLPDDDIQITIQRTLRVKYSWH